MKGKKGALELGVNAIVILIIALTVLGIAIAFIVGAFGQVKDKFNQALDNDPFSSPADSQTPIKFESEELNLVSGKAGQPLVISIYNTDPASTQLIIDSDTCTDVEGNEALASGAASGTPMLEFASGAVPVDFGEAKAVKTFVKVQRVAPGQYICRLMTCNGGSGATTCDPTQPETTQVQVFTNIKY